MNTTATLVPAASLEIGQQKIAVSGASGLVGSALAEKLRMTHQVINVTRHSSSPLTDVEWDAERGLVSPARLAGIDAFIHLAGENIATGRWTKRKKSRIRESRVAGTRRIAESLSRLESPPRVLICASAIGFYGDCADARLDESASAGHGFLAEVCQEWEAASEPAAEAGIRVVNLRIGVVISSDGGALPHMLTPFKLGVGGRIGTGKQFWSWVSIHDVVGAIDHCLVTPEMSGPVNCVSPGPVTNSEFTKTLGAVLSRPTILPMPAFAAKIALGQMAEDLLLASTQVLPRRLQETGYTFHYPELGPALQVEINQQTHGSDREKS